MKTSMKFVLALALSVFFVSGTFAQNAEPVYSFVRVIHEQEWYKQQAKAWKMEIDKDSQNKTAWANFYMANRVISKYFGVDVRKEHLEWLMPLDEIVQLAEKAIPNSFELYYFKAYKGYKSKDYEENVQKAHEISPYNSLILPNLMNCYQIHRDQKNIAIVSEKWFQSNETPQELLITAYNNLISLDQNAILLTYGDNDTYPCWILQYARKIRPDVLVLSIPLAVNKDDYRENVFRENNIPDIVFKDSLERQDSRLYKHLVETVHNRPIYVSVFASQDVYKDYQNRMYFTGLSLRYSRVPFNNLAVLRDNIENKFMLDFLKQSFYNNYAQTVVDRTNAGYLASFYKLSEYYKKTRETARSRKIKDLAITVSKNTGCTEWLKYFEK